jgi:hypothetical protein
MVRKIKAETVTANRKKWFLTHSIANAEKASKNWNRTIYRIPNGVYCVRLPKGKVQRNGVVVDI